MPQMNRLHKKIASHAYPSRTDIDESFYPDCAWMGHMLKWAQLAALFDGAVLQTGQQ
jgi:hypothetical protein